MSWFFSVALPADPIGCRSAARTLRATADAATAAADFLAHQATLSPSEFSGLTARSYRAAAAALETDSRGAASDTTGLAAALDAYADRIDDVRRVLERVRDDAVRAGLDVTADELVLWPPAPATEQDRTYQRLAAAAAGARTDQETAYSAWWQALQELTKGPLPSRV